MDLVRPFQLIVLDTSSLEEGEKKESKHIYYQKHIRETNRGETSYSKSL